MGQHYARIISAAAVLSLVGCGPVYLPAFYQLERPLLLHPDLDRDGWAIGANLSGGESLNSDRSRFTGICAGAAYGIGSKRRIVSLRSMAVAYGGTIGGESCGGIGIINEPALNLPLGKWLSINLLSEVGVAYEFGPYVLHHFQNPWFPSLSLGGGLTLHFSPQSRLAADCRLLVPFSIRLAYLTDSWGFHASTLRFGSAWSFGISYLLGQDPLPRR
ncbi:MAG: hypothetical protein NZ960_04670 [Candidatus Kapabacteria bacterium]|nr:hypothetical protein [Candidatus Kapabacteria bacterium]MDW8012059.1 hypothetical protein [Bacteroidota bacterium]